MTDFSQSQAYLTKALRVTPGASQTRSKAPGGIHPSEGYPVALTHGVGPYVWDLDGNRYFDLICGLAITTLGWNHDAVQRAVLGAINAGPLLSLPTSAEQRVSQKLCEYVGCDMVRWVKTGSEAMSAAVRLARLKTGRSSVLTARHSYHGWHDWHQASFNLDNGVPTELAEFLYIYINNDLQSVEEQFSPLSHLSRAGHKEPGVAAIILEPHRQEETDPAFVQGLREIADREGCALIFDDMVWGFRWHERGSRGWFNVEPDMQAFGKALGAGYPIACICGKEEWLEGAGAVSSTYGGDRIGLAAAEAVLDLYRKDGKSIVQRLWAIGHRLTDLDGLEGFSVHPRLTVDDPLPFLSTLAKRGVLAHNANWNVSLALEPHIDEIAKAITDTR